MKLASFLMSDGPGFGVVKDDQILRLDRQAGAAKDLKSFLPIMNLLSLGDLGDCERIALDRVTWLPPIPNPGRVFCVAMNFHEPANAGKPVPAFPLLFTRVAEAQVGHAASILKPAVSDQFDFEGEMAVIIGKPGHKIARAQAMDHIAGYSCSNDGSLRDWQKHSSQFTPGKNFYQSAGFGPWPVTRDDIPDTTKLRLETRINGVIKQEICLGQMIFSPSWLISYISTFCPLKLGDVIVTGTPSSFGATRTPKEFLGEGDKVEVEITDIGILCNEVRQDTDMREL